MSKDEEWFWECGVCGVMNEPSSDFCRLCNASREKGAPKVHSEEASGRAPGWYCPRCKTLNRYDICCVCGSRKPGLDPNLVCAYLQGGPFSIPFLVLAKLGDIVWDPLIDLLRKLVQGCRRSLLAVLHIARGNRKSGALR